VARMASRIAPTLRKLFACIYSHNLAVNRDNIYIVAPPDRAEEVAERRKRGEASQIILFLFLPGNKVTLDWGASQLKAKVGRTLAKAAALRVNRSTQCIRDV
jgi:hydrogenase maturation factor HypE